MLNRNRRKAPTKSELELLHNYYKEKTASISNEKAVSYLVSDDDTEMWHLFRLMDLAEYYKPLGKTKAIMFAFKLGYMAGVNQ